MSSQFENLLKRYDYILPPELIAQKPALPRDSAKLLVYNKKNKKVSYDTFFNLPKYLPERAVLVFNETKVVPARLTLMKETGGKGRILYFRTVGNLIEAMVDRRIEIGSRLSLTSKLFFIVTRRGKYYFLKPSFPISRLSSILERYGSTPIPPYIKDSPLSESALRREYQTIFARQEGSVAAPTASLHFTHRLFQKLKRAGFDVRFVTLHVNLGTFASLTEEQVKEKKLHKEWYEISKETARFLNRARKEGRPIIAVGTTVTRTLESASDSRSVLKRLTGETDLFINEKYRFKFIDGLITNFHVPKSSLLMLVSAFVGRDQLFDLYRKAIRKKFRFFSFGDGMLIV